jgi:Holliday junction resolvasome RuvABC endonuclease subunit
MTLKIYQGVDPGYGTIGIAEIKADPANPDLRPTLVGYRSIRTNPQDPFHVRLKRIFEAMTLITDSHKADSVIIEDPRFYGKQAITNSQNILKALGVIHLAYAFKGVVLKDIASTEVKLHCTAKGNAAKSDIRAFTKALFGVTHSDDDALDAIAIAVTGWRLDCESRLTMGRDVDARKAWFNYLVNLKPLAKEKKAKSKKKAA